ncbi:MAG: S-layer homology domain-containing protein, partial [Clostridia bacterium]|nr:S-layer homology domain-containing protein [Clostridia bacterium]
MKKRILSLILTVMMLLGLIALPTSAATGEMPFKDVKSGKWYYEAVKYVWENDLMNGVSEDKFAPNDPMNRAMLVTVLWRVEKSPAPKGTTPFTDLKAKWYKDAVAWAYENEIVNGMTATTFAPTNPITREQIATIIYRFATFTGRDTSAKGDLSKFPDGSKVAKYAKDAMTWAVGEGLISGTKVGDKDYLDPKGNATRAQVATILMRYLESASQTKTLEDLVDDMLDTYLCWAHGKLDLFFNYTGASLTEENVGNLLKKIGGLPETVTVEFDDFESMVEGYQGAGDGAGHYNNGWVWESNTVTFTDTATGETVERDIDFSFRKCLALSLFDEYKNGVLGIDPDSANETMKAAYGVLDAVTATKEEPYTGYTGEYTAEAIEAFFRELTGLTDKDSYGFLLPGFDPNTPGEPFWPMFVDLKNEEGRLDIVWIETVFAVPEKPLSEKIEDKLSDLLCDAHSRLDLEFGTSGSLTDESLNALLTDIFGYTATVQAGEADYIKSSDGPYYSGLGNGQFCWTDDIDVTFTDGDETYTASFKLSLMKNPQAFWAGAFESGVLSECPDEWPADATAAKSINDWDGLEVIIPGSDYTLEAVEAKLREMTGLGDGWEFFINGFDAAAYEGNSVNVSFKNSNINDEGRTIAFGGEVVLKIENPPVVVDPMHEAFEAFLDEYLCVTHGALTTMHKGGSNYNAANLGKLVLDTMGLDADTYSVVINGDISDPGVGIGQFCGAGNVEIYV